MGKLIEMKETVSNFRGCMSLRKGTRQRLDDEATKELLDRGAAFDPDAKKTKATKAEPKPVAASKPETKKDSK